VWSDMFERQLKDVFAVQDEISGAIADALGAQLATTTETRERGTSDDVAYDMYLRGRHFFEQRGEPSLRRALALFKSASQKDAKFARAYAGVAAVYSVLPLYSRAPSDTMISAGLQAATRAIQLDSSLAEAFSSRATLLQAGWRWASADADYQRALRLDPRDAAAHQWYGELLLLNSRTAEATVQLKRATELEPLSPIVFGSYSLALAAARQADAAITAAKRAVELDSALLVTRFMLGAVYLQAGRDTDAVRELQVAAALDTASTPTLGLLGYAYAKAGKPDRARELAARLEAKAGQTNGAAPAAARIYIALGDTQRALTLLERAVADHDAFFASESLAESFFDPLRSDRRFAGIIAKAGLDRRLLTIPK